MLKKIFIFLFISMTSYAGDVDGLMEHFKKELNSKNYKIEEIYKRDNNFTTVLPKNLKEPFSTYIDKSYKKLKKQMIKTFQDDCPHEKWRGYISYMVTYATKNLLSVHRVEEYSRCYMTELSISKYINLLFYNNRLYQIELSDSIKNRSGDIPWEEVDCKKQEKFFNVISKELKIKDGHPYIHAFLGMDKICGHDEKIGLKPENFKFTIIDKNDY